MIRSNGVVNCSSTSPTYTLLVKVPSYAFDAVNRGGVAVIRDLIEYIRAHPEPSS